MKKRLKSKAKTAKRSAKSSTGEKHELPDLVAVMMKVAERLDALEKKMDLVISQTSVRLSEVRQTPQNIQRQEPSHPGKPPQLPHPQQSHGRPGRVLHQSVCADCKKDCEVPFKPTGERPVYCKECFAKRKAERHSPKTNIEPSQIPTQQRRVKVIPNGVGRVTISEMVTSPSGRQRNKKK